MMYVNVSTNFKTTANLHKLALVSVVVVHIFSDKDCCFKIKYVPVRQYVFKLDTTAITWSIDENVHYIANEMINGKLFRALCIRKMLHVI